MSFLRMQGHAAVLKQPTMPWLHVIVFAIFVFTKPTLQAERPGAKDGIKGMFHRPAQDDKAVALPKFNMTQESAKCDRAASRTARKVFEQVRNLGEDAMLSCSPAATAFSSACVQQHDIKPAMIRSATICGYLLTACIVSYL